MAGNGLYLITQTCARMYIGSAGSPLDLLCRAKHSDCGLAWRWRRGGGNRNPDCSL